MHAHGAAGEAPHGRALRAAEAAAARAGAHRRVLRVVRAPRARVVGLQRLHGAARDALLLRDGALGAERRRHAPDARHHEADGQHADPPTDQQQEAREQQQRAEHQLNGHPRAGVSARRAVGARGPQRLVDEERANVVRRVAQRRQLGLDGLAWEALGEALLHQRPGRAFRRRGHLRLASLRRDRLTEQQRHVRAVEAARQQRVAQHLVRRAFLAEPAHQSVRRLGVGGWVRHRPSRRTPAARPRRAVDLPSPPS